MQDASGARAERVMAAMSGGVDSSTCALLLQRAGYEVVGATMVLFDKGADDVSSSPHSAETACGSSRDVNDARAVCERLGVPHVTFDMQDEFAAKVIGHFCEAYLEGRTPNPCIDCNRHMKFEALQQKREALRCDYVATGHYARRRFDEASGRWQLLRAKDPAKDQSYVLYRLTQDTLAHMLFPLGDLTKAQVRELAAESGFVTADKPESQDICFVPDGDYAGFIERRCSACAADDSAAAALPIAFQPGDIVDRADRVLGRHMGLIHYTIGQRKGIGVAAPEPLYVFAKDITRNQLVVGTAAEVLVNSVKACDINLIAVDRVSEPMRVQAKTHYRQRPVPGTLTQTGADGLTVVFDEPQRAAAPGQSLVVYQDDVVIGGGTIV